MASRAFKQVDVFTSVAYLGNPVAVVLDGTGLSDATMQSFARWTQLSETTFVLPPSREAKAQGADYKLRIFTPGGELPFAGHPTLGSASAWLSAGGEAQQAGILVQECGVGLVTLKKSEGRWAFAAPPFSKRNFPETTLRALLKALGIQAHQVIDSQILNNGPEWWSILLDDAVTLRQLTPDHMALKQLGVKVGVAALTEATHANSSLLISRSNRESRAFAGSAGNNLAEHKTQSEDQTKADAHLEVRAFAAAIGITEDPVTGSLNASLAQWLIGSGTMPRQYLSSQGGALGRQGRVHIQQDAQGQVWVGGDTVVCIEGHVALD
jgi:PhzF family phenazine biosynthesis protein